MLSLEQIRRLEQRVNEAVERINALEDDKRKLKEQLTEARAQASKLEAQLEQQGKDQAAIERGILAALEQLDQLEHEIADDSGTQGIGPPATEGSDDSFAGVEAPKSAATPNAESSLAGRASDSLDATPQQSDTPPQHDQELDIF
ncbi:MAG: cell division protein ZapB [Spirochaetia bacterium]